MGETEKFYFNWIVELLIRIDKNQIFTLVIFDCSLVLSRNKVEQVIAICWVLTWIHNEKKNFLFSFLLCSTYTRLTDGDHLLNVVSGLGLVVIWFHLKKRSLANTTYKTFPFKEMKEFSTLKTYNPNIAIAYWGHAPFGLGMFKTDHP